MSSLGSNVRSLDQELIFNVGDMLCRVGWWVEWVKGGLVGTLVVGWEVERNDRVNYTCNRATQ